MSIRDVSATLNSSLTSTSYRRCSETQIYDCGIFHSTDVFPRSRSCQNSANIQRAHVPPSPPASLCTLSFCPSLYMGARKQLSPLFQAITSHCAV